MTWYKSAINVKNDIMGLEIPAEEVKYMVSMLTKAQALLAQDANNKEVSALISPVLEKLSYLHGFHDKGFPIPHTQTPPPQNQFSTSDDVNPSINDE